MLSAIFTSPFGQMGKSLLDISVKDERFCVHATFSSTGDKKYVLDAEGNKHVVYYSFSDIPIGAHVLVDFSVPACTMKCLRYCAENNVPMVIGTTGFSAEQIQEIEQTSKQIPIFYAANMSFGVHLLSVLLQKTAPLLAENFDIEIVEKHHSKKIDAPSGTALALGRSITESIQTSLEQCATYDRSTKRQSRQKKEIGFSVVRGGDIVGEHQVLFLGEGERLILEHQATNRSLFSSGALRAAYWLCGTSKRHSGLYGMSDIF